MYIWSTKRLIEDLRNCVVSKDEKLKYMITSGIVVALVSDPILSSGLRYSYMDAANLVLTVIAVIGGTYYCYLQNKKGDNNDFITRITCLGIPVTVRVLVFGLPILLAIGAIEGALGIDMEAGDPGGDFYTTTATQVAAGLLLMAITFVYLGKSIGAVAAQLDPQVTHPHAGGPTA